MANPYFGPESLFSAVRSAQEAAGSLGEYPSRLSGRLGEKTRFRSLGDLDTAFKMPGGQTLGSLEIIPFRMKGADDATLGDMPANRKVITAMSGDVDIPSLLANAANQQSGSEQRGKAGESKEKGSAPPSRTNFSNTGLDESGRPRDDLSRYGADRYVPVGPRLDSSEYEGLRRNQTIQSGPSLDEMSDKPLVRSGSLDDLIPGSTVKWGSREGVTTTGGPQYSLSDVAGRDRVREQVDSAHQARLAAIGPDPYDERQKDISESRKREEEYQESQPASNDELNRLGLSGNYTRGQIKKVTETRAAQEAADERARYAADAAYRAAVEKARIEADAPWRGVPEKQQHGREALQEKYNQRLTRIQQDAARGLITPEEATYEAQKAKEEFAMFSNQASGKSIYTPAPSSGGL